MGLVTEIATSLLPGTSRTCSIPHWRGSLGLGITAAFFDSFQPTDLWISTSILGAVVCRILRQPQVCRSPAEVDYITLNSLACINAWLGTYHHWFNSTEQFQ